MTPAKEQLPLSAFISHRRESRVDNDLVRVLTEKLKQSNIIIFWDDLEAEAERPPDWDKKVFDAIQECRVVIPILSTQYLTSSTARGELLLALEEGKPVIPVLSEKCQIPKVLQNTPYIDATAWTPGDEACLSQIVSEISFNIYSPPSYPGTPRKTSLFSQAERTLTVDNHGVLSWKHRVFLDMKGTRVLTTGVSRLAQTSIAMKFWQATGFGRTGHVLLSSGFTQAVDEMRATGEKLRAELTSTLEHSRATDEKLQKELPSLLEAAQAVDETLQAKLGLLLEAERGMDEKLQKELPSLLEAVQAVETFQAELAQLRNALQFATAYSPRSPQMSTTVKPLVAGLAGITSLTPPFQYLLTRPVPEADQEPHTALASTGAAVREYVRAAFDTLKEEVTEKDE